MNNQKGLAPIIIIVVLAAIIGGGVFAWQKFGTSKQELKDETADWQTYTNEQYGFEFKYPSNLIVDTSISSKGMSFFGDEKELIRLLGKNDLLDFSFIVEVFNGNLDLLKNKINNYKEQVKQMYTQYGLIKEKEPQFSESTIVIGNKPGFIFFDKAGSNAEFFYTSLNDQNVLLIAKYKDEKLIGETQNENYELLSRQILSTFKFIEEATATEIIVTPVVEKICSYQTDINDVSYQYGLTFVAKDRNCATFIENSEGNFLKINGTLTKAYPDIFLNQSNFSPDGKRFAFVASNLKDNGRGDFFFNLNGKFQRFVVSDNTQGSTYDKILSSPQYSQDDKHLGYCAQRNDQYLKVIDEQEQIITKDIYLNNGCNSLFDYDPSPNRNYNLHQTVISPDSKSVLEESSCANTRATCEIYKTLMLSTGEEKKFGPYWDVVNYTQFSPDSKHFTYSAQIFEGGQPGMGIGKQYTAVILDGEIIDKHNEVWNLKFSDDSQFLIYNARLYNDIYYIVKAVE